jgi:DNA invertase Pin-like site-specific DNA recombinase
MPLICKALDNAMATRRARYNGRRPVSASLKARVKRALIHGATTHKEIARMAGCHPRSVTNVLNKIAEDRMGITNKEASNGKIK